MSKARIQDDPDDPRHGTYNGYGNLACRCEKCKKANARYCYEQKRNRALRLAQDFSIVIHGRASTYGNWGCRCRACTAEWTRVSRERRKRLGE